MCKTAGMLSTKRGSGGRRDLRVAVVTGGAQGIGAATAAELARRGLAVAIGDVDVERAQDTAGRLGARAGRLDVTDPASWDAFLEDVEAGLGPVDVLVNNAGIMPVGLFTEEPDAVTDLQLAVNVRGVLLGCRAVLPGMLERGRGHLVDVASQAGKIGVAGGVTYCATKWAVVGLSHALDDELRDTPVTVSCVLPGMVHTELSTGVRPTRWTPRVEPQDVAAAIADTLQRPRREVWVPRARATMTATRMLPARPRARLSRLLGIGDALLDAETARRDYEARARGAQAVR